MSIKIRKIFQRPTFIRKEFGALPCRALSTPAFELDLVPHYPSVNIWLLMGTIYLETGQIIDAKLFAKYMGMYLPNLQTVY